MNKQLITFCLFMMMAIPFSQAEKIQVNCKDLTQEQKNKMINAQDVKAVLPDLVKNYNYNNAAIASGLKGISSPSGDYSWDGKYSVFEGESLPALDDIQNLVVIEDPTFCYVMCNADTGLCDFIKIYDVIIPSPLGKEHGKKIGIVHLFAEDVKL
jgi:hypothetical protein